MTTAQIILLTVVGLTWTGVLPFAVIWFIQLFEKVPAKDTGGTRMSQMQEEPFKLEAKAEFIPPSDLLAVARMELSHYQYDLLLAWLGGQTVTPALYVDFKGAQA